MDAKTKISSTLSKSPSAQTAFSSRLLRRGRAIQDGMSSRGLGKVAKSAVALGKFPRSKPMANAPRRFGSSRFANYIDTAILILCAAVAIRTVSDFLSTIGDGGETGESRPHPRSTSDPTRESDADGQAQSSDREANQAAEHGARRNRRIKRADKRQTSKSGESIEDTITKLIASARQTADGYTRASERLVDQPEMAHFFDEQADYHNMAAGTLERRLMEAGKRPNAGILSAPEAQGWTQPADDDNPKSIIEACHEGEERTAAAFNAALQELPEDWRWQVREYADNMRSAIAKLHAWLQNKEIGPEFG